jgi:uncharacterized protein (DUF302 family)
MQITSISVQHVTVQSNHDFSATIQRFEKQLGTFDPGVIEILAEDPGRHTDEVRSKLQAMEGPSCFMRFGPVQNHGLLLPLVGKAAAKARQYVIGNPLFAVEMTRHDLRAGLYAPLRVLVYEDRQGATCLEYDLPSSLFGQFNDQNVRKIGMMLDQKMEKLVNETIV